MERNLHDGIQQRLVTLALELRTVNDGLICPEFSGQRIYG
jgi:signal transduction histidine kinase